MTMGLAARPHHVQRTLWVVGIAVAGAVAAVLGVLWATASVPGLVSPSCCPPAGPCLVGSRPCPVSPLPSPTSYIAAGTVFAVAAGGFTAFSFQLSPATSAVVNGSFTTTQGVAVAIMVSAEYASFSVSLTAFQCMAANWCFTTGPVASGAVNDTLPVFPSSSTTGVGTVAPWYLVMENPNASVPTNVTWTTSLTATYIVVYV
jgi:hypothetical protein